MKKNQIRKIILKKRKYFNKKNIKINISELLKLLNQKIKTKKIGLYYSIGSELSTVELIENLRKKNFIIALPALEKNFKMSFYEWTKNSSLKINNFGIPEPFKSKKITPSVLIVPIVAFDANLNRLGYGGGFYDRYFEKNSNSKKVVKIGLAFSFQKIKKLPINKFDKKLDKIITEKRI